LVREKPWFFFFSSRRRHTRFSRDWSSDVCSSDLYPKGIKHLRWRTLAEFPASFRRFWLTLFTPSMEAYDLLHALGRQQYLLRLRSEERRVGKESSTRWTQYHEQNKTMMSTPKTVL